ncbi:MAG: GNAT family N-acetyltransferase [Rhodothermales bacterium]|nr:GNAT family N-acetyltransferase [Rhodothermales bacterium]
MSDITIRRAGPEDAAVLLALIRELAEYEKLAHQVVGTEAALAAHLHPDAKPGCGAFLAETEAGDTAGFALYYWSYSTFLTGWGIYLEDLFVRESHRGQGIGLQLLSRVAQETLEQRGERLDWQVLDWNAPSIAFYESLGARMLGEWEPMRLEGDALAGLASRYSGTI